MSRPKKSTKRKAAREVLIATHLPRAHAIAARIHLSMPPHVDVEDLKSAATVALIQAADRFGNRDPGQFGAWSFKRICGAVKDELRSMDYVPRRLRTADNHAVHRGGKSILPSSQPLDDALIERLGIGAGGETAEAVAVRRELFALAVKGLSKRHRRIIRLVFEREQMQKDVARSMGIHPSAIAHTKRQILRDMASRLASVLSDDFPETHHAPPPASPKPLKRPNPPRQRHPPTGHPAKCRPLTT